MKYGHTLGTQIQYKMGTGTANPKKVRNRDMTTNMLVFLYVIHIIRIKTHNR